MMTLDCAAMEGRDSGDVDDECLQVIRHAFLQHPDTRTLRT